MTDGKLTKAAATQQGRAADAGPRNGPHERPHVGDVGPNEGRVGPQADPRDCLIRARCRWRANDGDAACASCGYVVTPETVKAAGLTTRSVV